MTDPWRCFIAVPLDDALRGSLVAAVTAWRTQPPAEGLRWVDPDGWHVTVAFLGPVPVSEVGSVIRTIGSVAAAHRPTRVETGRLGAFHRPGSVRTLWYGIGDPDGRLAALASLLSRALGLDEPDPFRPHVTLARARQRPVDLRGWIERASREAPPGSLGVDRVLLLRSHLGQGPARYETLASFALGGDS